MDIPIEDELKSICIEIVNQDHSTHQWLENWLKKFEELPKDLEDQPSIKAAAKRLLDTACDLEIKPGFNLEWFAVRLDHPAH